MGNEEKSKTEPPAFSPHEADSPTHGSRFGLLKISGTEAKKFLQGQVTCNMDEVSETESRLGAHCNPQGRVLFLFRVFYFRDAYYLVLPREMVCPALSCLKKYAIFFKLELSDASAADSAPLQKQALEEAAYFKLSQGIPQVYPETQGLFLPQELGLHELQGLSWDKGCYTGQEIIARLHYRGKLKNQLYHASIQTAVSPRRGAEIYCSSPQGFSPSGFIVDFAQVDYNHYELLILSSETNRSKALKLDPLQNETGKWSP